MVITSSGPRCDVCGGYILPLGDTMMREFRIKGIDSMLHVGSGLLHETCTASLEAAIESGKWQDLPAGPLRKGFADAEAKTAEAPPSPDVADEPVAVDGEEG